jgi:hypothetical protein
MRSCYPLVLGVRSAACVSRDRVVAVSAHPSSRRDRGDPVELSLGRARRSLDGLGRQVEDARSQLDPGPASGHDRDHLPLELAELSHEVRGAGEPILELDDLIGRGVICGRVEGGGLEVHTRASPNANPTTALVLVAQQEPHSRPESANEVLLGRDRLAHHYDNADRLVD